MTTTNTQPSKLIRLRTAIQTYDWGKPGSSSLSAQLAPGSVGPDFKLDEKTAYAETWIGTHSNGPSTLYANPSISLSDFIVTNPPRHLGQKLLQKWPESRADVPFLFKILTCAKALPLQVHPDKALAERLHASNPKEFVDANHKPEIAVAVGEALVDERLAKPEEGIVFLGFAGFKPLEEIKAFVEGIPELKEAIANDEAVRAFLSHPSKETLKAVYAALLSHGKAQPKSVAAAVRSLVSRIKSGEAPGVIKRDPTVATLMVKADEQYPGDVGGFATSLFMNLARLRKGEAIYVGADEVHAWLEGEIIECMAISDNVINVAFVPPEERDIDTFTSALTFTSRPAAHWSLPRKPYKRSRLGRTVAFDPPFEEFCVLGTSVGGGEESKEILEASPGPMAGIVVKVSREKGKVRFRVGEEKLEVEKGGVVFVVPESEVEVEALGGGEGAEVWWALGGVGA